MTSEHVAEIRGKLGDDGLVQHFLDHGDINLGDFTFTFLIVLDAATGLIMAYPCDSKGEDESQESLREFLHHASCTQKAVC